MNERCHQLQTLLMGEVEYMGDLEEGREHLRECIDCQKACPDAIAQLDSIQSSLLRYTSSQIESIYYQYQTDIALAKCGNLEEVQSGETGSPHEAYNLRVLARLARAGWDIREELQHLNDSWGLDEFRPSDPGCEYSSKTFSKAMVSLPHTVRLFVYESTVAAELTLLFNKVFPAEYAERIHNILKHAAPEFLKSFFPLDSSQESTAALPSAKDGEISLQQSGVYERIDQKLDEFCDRSGKDLDDAVDSLKACQMEMMRLLTRWIERSAQRQVEDPFREGTSIPPGPLTAGPDPEPMQLTPADLGEIRHLLLRVLNFLEGPAANNLEIRESAGSRVNRLRDAQKIPGMVAKLMRVVLDFRNAAEYNEYKLSAEESGVVRAAWRSIAEWAKKQGWEPPSDETVIGSNAA